MCPSECSGCVLTKEYREFAASAAKGQMAIRPIRELLRDDSGTIAPLIMFSLPVFIGFLALSMDMGSLYFTKSQLQAVSDSVALAAATRFDDTVVGATLGLTYSEKNMPAASYGTVMDADDLVYGTWNLSTSVFTAGATPFDAVRATANRTDDHGNSLSTFFAQFFNIQSFNVQANAVAIAVLGEGLASCLTSLSEDAEDALKVIGVARITAAGCDITVNSNHDCAMRARGTPTVTTIDAGANPGSINVVGDYCENGNVTVSPTPVPDSSPDPDPFLHLSTYDELFVTEPTTDMTCDFTNHTVTDSATFEPGVYCGGITATGSGTLTFNSGNYVIKDGAFDIGGNQSLSGDQTGFFLTGTDTYLNIRGTADLGLTAPLSGPLEGFVFYQDPDTTRTPAGQTHFMRGTTDGGIDGVVYLPNSGIEFKGIANSGLAATDCAVYITDTFFFNGTTDLYIDNTCTAGGFTVPAMGIWTYRLVD